MNFDFDRIIDRRSWYSSKHNTARQGKPENILPLWVADMDFQTAPGIIEALEKMSRHGIFGYAEKDEEYYEILKSWFAGRFDWRIENEWLVNTPGVVTALFIAVHALTEPGDAVIVQQPVYYPFEFAICDTGRRMIVSDLLYEDGRYSIDFDDFEGKIKDNGVKLFILCSPHNPVGRVWTREELTKLGEICLRNGVMVISDEIHQDFVYPGHKHHVFAALDSEFAKITVTCTAPSKTFNLAGLQLSNIFIENSQIRERFLGAYFKSGISPSPGVMGIAACKAAYSTGEPWLKALLEYLSGNLALIRDHLKERVPQIKLVEPDGTYLAWLDCKALGIGGDELDELMEKKAGLWLDGGTMFGKSGDGFQRVNYASPRSVIQDAMERLEKLV